MRCWGLALNTESPMPLADFIHLRVHTAYSLSAGAIKIKELVGLCKTNKMPAVAIATSDGILQIPPMYIRAAKTLGTSPIAMPLTVILPAALPIIVTGIKLGWTLGWHGAVSAELIKSTVGLGYLLSMGREVNDAAQVIGIMVVTILVGLLLDRFFFGLIEGRIRRRWGLEMYGWARVRCRLRP